ncbi:ATP-binding cassette domain-containing protein [Streptomyces sp. NPDC047046]|uniref:ABC-F family ATP-binding cassette domain-containing protein n=1 Tax=Streptomyces sp. NPDC047046 TaxID=3155378 RepID=UPI0033F7EC31
MSDAYVVSSALSFSWPDETPVFDRLSFTVPGGRTGLVAPNGSGKSTLLRLIAAELTPTSGSVTVNGTLGHLPQTLPLSTGLTVAEVLGVAGVIAAIDAVERGEVDEEHFTTIGEDWDIEERTRAELDRLGLGRLTLDQGLESLSGGQIVTLGLAAQLLARPDVLLLDEPTNNLDLEARHRLHGVVDDWRGCLLVVSHDRALLDRMDRIAELERGELRYYGGNFAAYEEAVSAEREVAEKNVRHAEAELKREKREMQQARERAERRSSNAARNIKNAGLPKILAGARQRKAQESAGRAGNTHADRVGEARARLDEAGRAVRDDTRLVLDLPGTEVPAGRTLFEAKGLRLRGLFAGEGVDRLDLLDPALSVAENLAAFAPTMPEADRMNLLARFLFRGQGAHLKAGDLSGGELLRATLACVLSAEPAPHLLLLDEPTNNLDLVSVGQLESALTSYRGAFLVVSHDDRFLAEIGVTRYLRLAEGELREVAAPAAGE